MIKLLRSIALAVLILAVVIFGDSNIEDIRSWSKSNMTAKYNNLTTISFGMGGDFFNNLRVIAASDSPQVNKHMQAMVAQFLTNLKVYREDYQQAIFNYFYRLRQIILKMFGPSKKIEKCFQHINRFANVSNTEVNAIQNRALIKLNAYLNSYIDNVQQQKNSNADNSTINAISNTAINNSYAIMQGALVNVTLSVDGFQNNTMAELNKLP